MCGKLQRKRNEIKNSDSVKVAWIASSGGHILELAQLRNVWEKYEGYLITEKSKFQEVTMDTTYYIRQMNRKDVISWFLFLPSFFHAYHVLRKEKTTHIISTGAMCAFPFIIMGKLLGCKIIYIESFARVDDQSLTGRLVYKYTDMFIVQWPELLKKYPKAILGGSIF